MGEWHCGFKQRYNYYNLKEQELNIHVYLAKISSISSGGDYHYFLKKNSNQKMSSLTKGEAAQSAVKGVSLWMLWACSKEWYQSGDSPANNDIEVWAKQTKKNVDQRQIYWMQVIKTVCQCNDWEKAWSGNIAGHNSWNIWCVMETCKQ